MKIQRECKVAPIRRRGLKSTAAGFTLLEVSIILAVVGILASILVPSWKSLMDRVRLNHANDVVYQAIRDAQGMARRTHIPQQVSFRFSKGMVQWSAHAANANVATVIWNDLDPIIQLDSETTLQQVNGVRRVQFDEDGNVNGQLGRLTLSTSSDSLTKRCIMVSTLIGAVRKGENRRTKQDGKFCY